MALKVAVIGTGSLGRHHARNLGALAELGGLELAGVVDPSEERGKAAAELGKTRWIARPEDLPKVDAVSIAAPTPFHFELAKSFLEQGVHVMVEKPMCATLAQAEDLVKIAARSGRVLQVGHIERFNPVLDLMPVGELGVCAITAERLTVHTGRSTDTSVVFDLMIHDIDLVRAFAKSEIAAVDAETGVVSGPLEDWASARLEFENGIVATIVASRVASDRARRTRLYCADRVVDVDFDKRKLAITARAPGAALPAVTTADGTQEEPLKRELFDFVRCIREGAAPRVGAKDGLAAIAIADKVLASARR